MVPQEVVLRLSITLTQALWAGNNFTCSNCQPSEQESPSDTLDRQSSHAYNHPLVRCKVRVEDPQRQKDPTMSELGERVRKLEERIDDLQGKVDTRFQNVEKNLEVLKGLIVQLVESRGES